MSVAVNAMVHYEDQDPTIMKIYSNEKEKNAPIDFCPISLEHSMPILHRQKSYCY